MRHRSRWFALVALGLAVLASWYFAPSAPPPPPPPVQIILGDPAAQKLDEPVSDEAVRDDLRRQMPTDRPVELEATQPRKDPCDPLDPMCGGL